MEELEDFVDRIQGLKLVDERTSRGGRIWIHDESHQVSVIVKLHGWNFEWSEARQAWYYLI